MKCVNCGDNIPVWLKLDGRRHNLSNRTRCVKCLPFLSKKGKLFRSPSEQRKRKSEKLKEGYYEFKQNSGGVPRTTVIRERNKKFLVNLLGGGCQLCGYSKVLKNLVFHHVVPENKNHDLSSSRLYMALSGILPEIMKCLLICHNCHGEVHEGEYEESFLSSLLSKNVEILSFLEGKTWISVIYEREENTKEPKPRKPQVYKAMWPSDGEMSILVQSNSLSSIAKKLGVSDTSVKKHCKKRGIETHGVGYWEKLAAGKIQQRP